MKKCILLCTIMAIYSAGYGGEIHSLYTDHRAMTVDDILTVLVFESAKAGSESSTNTRKNNSAAVSGVRGTGMLDFIPEIGASGGSDLSYDGQAGTSRQGSLTARVSTRVVEVLDNGNLVIEGNKVVEINNEKEIITVSGVVRPQDIESNNIVYSHNIANAQITYSGTGAVHEGSRPGLIVRFLNFLF